MITSTVLVSIFWISAFGQDLGPANVFDRYSSAVVVITGLNDGKNIDLGNGFIINSDGVIVTNYHSISGGYPIEIKSKMGDIYDDISIIDFNKRLDIAVIKIKGFDLPFVELGNSNDVRAGDKVYIVGSLKDKTNIISNGLITQIVDTNKGYSLHGLNISISDSACGSPVFNIRGEVIGIAARSKLSNQENSFSIPINYARGIVGGPIKYALKEFMARESEPVVNAETEKEALLDSASTLELLHKNIVTLLSASDKIIAGYYGTADGFKGQIGNKQARLDSNIFAADELLRALQIDLAEKHYTDSFYQSINDTLVVTVIELQDALKLIQKALEARTIRSDVFGTTRNFASPDWVKARSGVKKIDEIIMSNLGEKIVGDIIDRIRVDNPRLENDLTPYFIEVYEKRGNKQEVLIYEDRNQGHLGITTWKSLRTPVVLSVKTKGPADLAKIMRGDTIIGVDGGINIMTHMDYITFMKTTKPGETHIFRFSRNGKNIKAAIKLD
jgi:S1-C subfamily serine protease